jgi:hypothetical protein
MKQDGVFVCQTCGTKYSVEEAKKMMVEGVVDVTGSTVKIDNTAQIQNFLDLSQTAYESGNGESAFDYANKALEIAPNNSQAWIAKMKSIEYMGTFGNLRLAEVVECGKKAIAVAPKSEKGSISYEVYYYQATRSIGLLKSAIAKISDTEDVKRQYKKLSAISVIAAAKKMIEIDGKVIEIYDNVANEALNLALLIPDEVLVDFPDLAKIIGECAKQYQYETDALVEREKIYCAAFTDDALSARKSNRVLLEEKARKAEVAGAEKAAKEKAERIKKYWADHCAEKESLDSEKAGLSSQIEGLNAQISTLPEVTAVSHLEEQIDAKTKEKESLGFFKGKEKKALQAELETLNAKLADAKRAKDAVVLPINESIKKLQKRVSEIETELTKDR